MSDILFVFFVGSTKIGEISDISKCFENFVSQTLGVLARIYAAELRVTKKNHFKTRFRVKKWSLFTFYRTQITDRKTLYYQFLH